MPLSVYRKGGSIIVATAPASNEPKAARESGQRSKEAGKVLIVVIIAISWR